MKNLMLHLALALAALSVVRAQDAAASSPATNPLWHESKVKNYLPHMSWPEVQDLLTRSDMVIIPVGSMEQHGLHGPIGTDILNGLERAKLVAQKTDVLVAPILMPGNSPYHMEFPGTITLSAETIERVYFEAVTSLIRHGFRRFMLLNSHAGNLATTRFIVDRINQETPGIAVELGEAIEPFRPAGGRRAPAVGQAATVAAVTAKERVFDRHAGVGETSSSLYLTPNLVNMTVAKTATLTLPPHLEKMLPQVIAGEPTATRVFLAEGLKAKETGKHTSTREMSDTGTWGVGEISTASAEQGRRETEAFVDSAVQFIELWRQLRPMGAK